MAFRKRNLTGAIRGQVFLHEAKFDVFETVFGKETPGETVDKLMGHDEHNEHGDEQNGALRRRPEKHQGIDPSEKEYADGQDGNAKQQCQQVRLDDANGQVGHFEALLEIALASGFECAQAFLLFGAQLTVGFF